MFDLPHRLADALGDRYRLDRELGVGGMATVYLAHDIRHAREVAIKVLRAELTDLVGRERFLREIRVAAALGHPHILPLLDSGEADAQLFYVMPVVRGESLRTRLEGGPLPVGDAVRLVAQAAQALEHAHKAGVVHRDIKPENILLQDGQALVTDFGIARAMDSAHGNTLTQAGMSVGTPAYMSPEQAVGETVDGRSDQYALGCVLYECLVGEPPFTGPTVQAVIAKRFVQTPADVHALREGVPRSVARALQRALQRTPIDRFESMAAFAGALLDSTTASTSTRASNVPEQSVAVLAFDSPSGIADDEFFADGITEEILTALAQHPELKVAGRASSFSFKGKHVDPRIIAEQLGVRTVLEGSVRRSRDRVRITARLVDAEDGYQIWSERYDRELEDVFAVQDEISVTIAQRLRATLAVNAPARRQRTTASVEAYEAYLKGRALIYRRGRHIRPGLAQMQKALAADPTYALAWAGIADTYTLLAYYGFMRVNEARGPAAEASQKALEFAPDLAEANASRGLYEVCLAWNWERGEELLTRAFALDPHYVQGAAWYHFFIRGNLFGRWREAADGIAQLVARDPLSAYAHGIGAACAGYGGFEGEARVHADRAIELDPDAFVSWHCGLCAWVATGPVANIRRIADGALSLSGRAFNTLGLFGLSCIQHGDQEGAELVFRELEARAPREPHLPLLLATLAALLGHDARAASWFDAADRARDPQLVQWLHVDGLLPVMRGMCDSPLFRALFASSGLTAFHRARGTPGWA
ncbi:MAG TPA: protein kinase [Gemmatimonas sp.]|nr:protein kinase [Gemmatimonas sp.]